MKYLCLIIAVLFIVLAMLGCNSQKHVAKSTVNKDSLAVVELTEKLTVLKSENAEYKRRVQELEYLGVTFTTTKPINLDSLKAALVAANCPEADIKNLLDVLVAANSEIQILKDGTIQIKGQISSLTRSKSRLEEENATIKKENQELKESLVKARTEVKTETKEKIIEKKTSFIPWWVWLIVAVAGIIAFWMWINNRKLSPLKIKL